MAAPGPGGGTVGTLLIFSPRNEVNIYYISSSAQATQSTGTAPIPANPLDTRLFYLGSGFGNAEAGGWYGSETSSYSGSKHNIMFWMYGNASTFNSNYGNLYYNTFQTRSTIVAGNLTFTSGIVPFNISQQAGNEFIVPPINAPAYNYQLSASKTTISILEATTQSINNWTTLLQDSLRSGSGNTIFGNTPQGYGGQFNTSNGTYTFIRQNLPFNPVEAIPVEISLSFGDGSFTNRPDSQTPPQYPVIVRIISGSTVLRSTSFTLPETPNINDNYQFYTTLNIYSGSNGSSANLNTAGGITMSIINPDPQYPVTLSPINLNIKQPLTGRQIAAHPPITYGTANGDPTINDSGSYIVITPNLRGLDVLQPGPLTGNETQLNYTFACYYFKSAYHLWRDAWQVQSADGGPICPQSVWISASSNPSWGQYLLYSSQSSAPAFAGYGTSSIDGRVRNRAYIGITAELLGGSNIVPHLKANFAGTTSASFAGNKFGGMIVVKASNVGKLNNYDLGQTNFVWAQPGDSAENLGLPSTEVNDSDVVPFSDFLTPYLPSDLTWKSNISWPPANPYAYNPE